MGAYIGNLLDNGLAIFGLSCVIYLYSKSAEKRAKHRWMIPLCSILVIYNFVSLAAVLAEGPPPNLEAIMAKTPSREQLLEMVNKAKVVAFESPVKLKQGPRLTIPGGYKYVEPVEGGIICYSIGPINETLVVSTLGALSDLSKAEAEIRRTAKEKNRPWQLGPSHKEIINGCEAHVMKFTNPQMQIQGYHILVTNGRNGYLLQLTCPDSYVSISEASFQKIIQSFAVGL